MRLRAKIHIAYDLIRARLGLLKRPVFVSWVLTRACNYQCVYCNDHEGDGKDDMTTAEVLSVIDTLAASGTRLISFTGGEPLLRADIGQILRYCHDQGILTTLNTNGSLVPEKIDDIMTVDQITLSLDGPEEINDSVRGQGAYRKVLKAIRVLQAKHIRVKLVAVLSEKNAFPYVIDYLTHLGMVMGVPISFHPAIPQLLRGHGQNPIVMSQTTRYMIMSYIMSEKNKCKRLIRNPDSVLRYYRAWPHVRQIQCASGYIFLRIDNNGDIVPCGLREHRYGDMNCKTHDVAHINEGVEPFKCGLMCCSVRLEMNYLFSLFPDVIWNAIKHVL